MTEGAGIAWFNRLTPERAVQELTRCCHAPEWAREVVDRRPFVNSDALLTAANDAWERRGHTEWRVAIEHHPRIGEPAADDRRASTADWSRQEQAGFKAGDREDQLRLTLAQRAYEARFGHIFLICASGKSAREMADALERRMHNDDAAEIEVAAEELRKIMNLRLEKLIDGEPDHDART